MQWQRRNWFRNVCICMYLHGEHGVQCAVCTHQKREPGEKSNCLNEWLIVDGWMVHGIISNWNCCRCVFGNHQIKLSILHISWTVLIGMQRIYVLSSISANTKCNITHTSSSINGDKVNECDEEKKTGAKQRWRSKEGWKSPEAYYTKRFCVWNTEQWKFEWIWMTSTRATNHWAVVKNRVSYRLHAKPCQAIYPTFRYIISNCTHIQLIETVLRTLYFFLLFLLLFGFLLRIHLMLQRHRNDRIRSGSK